MDILTSLSIVAFAALIHASFQLSVSVLTLLSGHALGARKARAKVLRMTAGFLIGAGVMTLLLLSFAAFILLHLFSAHTPLIVWAIACGLVLGIGIAVWLFYYRRVRTGTELWVPRFMARHLTTRSKATQYSAEAFSLGLTSTLAEFLFIVPSIGIAALVLIQLPWQWQLAGIGIYTFISLAGLLTVWVLIHRRVSIGAIQKWREHNKRFLQFAAGSALVVLGFFVYVNQVMSVIMEAQ